MTIERGRDTYGKQREMAIEREREIHIANTEREMSPEAALRNPCINLISATWLLQTRFPQSSFRSPWTFMERLKNRLL